MEKKDFSIINEDRMAYSLIVLSAFGLDKEISKRINISIYKRNTYNNKRKILYEVRMENIEDLLFMLSQRKAHYDELVYIEKDSSNISFKEGLLIRTLEDQLRKVLELLKQEYKLLCNKEFVSEEDEIKLRVKNRTERFFPSNVDFPLSSYKLIMEFAKARALLDILDCEEKFNNLEANLSCNNYNEINSNILNTVYELEADNLGKIENKIKGLGYNISPRKKIISIKKSKE